MFIFLLHWVNCCYSIKLISIRFSQKGIKSGCALFAVIPSERSKGGYPKNKKKRNLSHNKNSSKMKREERFELLEKTIDGGLIGYGEDGDNQEDVE